jgi:hypothetical protein
MEYLQRFKLLVLLILVMLIFGGNLAAQTPHHYNYENVGTSYNNFPLGMNAGKAASWLFLPGEFSQPFPAPPGTRITKIYFFMKSNGVAKTYTNLHILMKQDTITSFTTGQFYPGPWDTVFVGDTTLTGFMNQWMGIPLETKYNYDPTKSLLVFIGQCAATGNGGGTICQLELQGVRRVWSEGGCPFVPWPNSDAKIPNFGIDVEMIIPVELTSFTANVIDNSVELNWTTATELNNSGFEIFRLNVNQKGSWEKTGFVPGFGTTTEPKSYSFIDEYLHQGLYSYRLKQIDYDGTFEYSENVEAEVTAPVGFELSQNYPNPFNPTTTLSFVIGHRSFVTLKVYDVLGNEIATLVNEELPAGEYEVEFSRNLINQVLTSGIYFYQIKAGNYIQTKKMILLK